MDSLSGLLQRNTIGQLSGTLTLNNYNISGSLTPNNYSMSGNLGASRVYPVVPTQEKTVVSSLVQQIVVPDQNKKLSKVTVQALPVSRVLNEQGGYTITIGV